MIQHNSFVKFRSETLASCNSIASWENIEPILPRISRQNNQDQNLYERAFL